jgi:ribosomal 50S subunit-recycling heat shock protein
MEQEFKLTFDSDALAIEEDDLEEDDDESTTPDGERVLKVRLDKWLWAARFFKTRPLARAAVESGKVFYNGQRSKPSREIEVDAVLQVRHGRHEKTIIVKGLSTRRRSTEEAFQLFEETEESKQIREPMPEFQPPSNSYAAYRPKSERATASNYSHPEIPSSRERRSVRFLRRSFNRGDEQPAQVRRPHSAQSIAHYNQQQPRYNNSLPNQNSRYGERQPRYYKENSSRYNNQQPLSNDNLPPLSHFRNTPKLPRMPWEDEKFD